MTLTRSDYEMIVYCLTTTTRPTGSMVHDNTNEFYHEIITNFLQHLSADNPRFDKNKFLNALDHNGWKMVQRHLLKD